MHIFDKSRHLEMCTFLRNLFFASLVYYAANYCKGKGQIYVILLVQLCDLVAPLYFWSNLSGYIFNVQNISVLLNISSKRGVMIKNILDFNLACNILLFDMISIYLIMINPIPFNLKSSVYTLNRYPSNINPWKGLFYVWPWVRLSSRCRLD